MSFAYLSGWRFEVGSDAMRTAKTMAALVRRTIHRNAPFIAFANRIARPAKPYADRRETIKQVRQWMDRNFRFINDPVGIESLKAPFILAAEVDEIGYSSGDCDEAAMLAAALGMANGLPARFRVQAFQPERAFSHVFAELFADGQWYPVDPTKPPNMAPGTRIAREFTVTV